jgi:hypothetical protein
MLDYFGQSPIIVRSSSLLEDNFGNAFAGKYDSVFLASQGPRNQRLEDFMSAARSIYSSTMSESALKYRARRSLLNRDEQMALLVQRVSGSQNGSLFFPHLAGVGFSYNSWVWDESINPEAGVVRLVMGLGTRAVDRSDDDYTRLVALNQPQKRPELASEELSRFAQHKVDVLALSANQLASVDFAAVTEQSTNLPLETFASRDRRRERVARERGTKPVFPWLLTLDGIVDKTSFVSDLRQVLNVLHTAYNYPVDIEFAANIFHDGSYRINLLQCRPLQVQGGGSITSPPDTIQQGELILKVEGAVIGQSRLTKVDRLIYVVPALYGQLPIRDRHAIARLVGRVTQLKMATDDPSILLLGPGRWGTTTPSLGVPVSFGEINRVSAICEIVAMREDLTPDVSLGTHFFSDLVEMNMLYMALFPERQNNSLNEQFFLRAPNKLSNLLPNTREDHAKVLRVIDVEELPGNCEILLYANTLEQMVVCSVVPPIPAAKST